MRRFTWWGVLVVLTVASVMTVGLGGCGQKAEQTAATTPSGLEDTVAANYHPKVVRIALNEKKGYALELLQEGNGGKAAYQRLTDAKVIHLSHGHRQSVIWMLAKGAASVDSVVADFGARTPFEAGRFVFSQDMPGISGPPVVAPADSAYRYDVTVYLHGRAPVVVDPGIIIDI